VSWTAWPAVIVTTRLVWKVVVVVWAGAKGWAATMLFPCREDQRQRSCSEGKRDDWLPNDVYRRATGAQLYRVAAFWVLRMTQPYDTGRPR